VIRAGIEPESTSKIISTDTALRALMKTY